MRPATLCRYRVRLMSHMQLKLEARPAMPNLTRLISTHHNIESSLTSERKSVVLLAAVRSQHVLDCFAELRLPDLALMVRPNLDYWFASAPACSLMA